MFVDWLICLRCPGCLRSRRGPISYPRVPFSPGTRRGMTSSCRGGPSIAGTCQSDPWPTSGHDSDRRWVSFRLVQVDLRDVDALLRNPAQVLHAAVDDADGIPEVSGWNISFMCRTKPCCVRHLARSISTFSSLIFRCLNQLASLEYPDEFKPGRHAGRTAASAPGRAAAPIPMTRWTRLAVKARSRQGRFLQIVPQQALARPLHDHDGAARGFHPFSRWVSR